LSFAQQFRRAQQHEGVTMGRKKATNATTEPITLAKLSEKYLEHMEQDGKSVGTCFSYTMELKTAIAELGADTIVSEITPALVEKFNACDRVMRLKSGKPKAPPSYLKTQRVLRLALTWAAQNGLIATAPYPLKDHTPEPEPTPAPAQKKTPKTKRAESPAPSCDDAPAPSNQVEAEPTAA
jgi:hypothetical protein